MAQTPVKRTRDSGGFERRFESIERLDTLLASAGSTYSTFEVAEGFRLALKDGANAGDVIPDLFESEPRFADPSLARALYGNLFGLWDMLAQGQTLGPADKTERSPKPEPRPREPKPRTWGAQGPTLDDVQAAFRYLEDQRPHELRRWNDIFENRYDSLLGWLDASGLSDEGFAVARHLLFELFVMLELGLKQGAASIDATSLQVEKSTDLPAALTAWVTESIFEAEEHDEAPLPKEEAKKAQACVLNALGALWRASHKA